MKLKITSVALYLLTLIAIQLQLSCAIEDEKVIENGVKLETSNLTLEDFKSKININQNNKLFEKFDITQRNISSFRLQQNNFIKIIHTKKITFFKTADGLQTFTMPVTTNIVNDQAITNIVYYLKNNKLNFKVIRYFPTQKWKNQNAVGINIPYEGTLKGYNSNEINLSNTIAAKQGTFCPVAYVPIWLCNAGFDHAPGCYAGGNQIVGVRTIWGACPEPEPVGGSGGDPPPATEPNPEPPTGGTGNPVETPLIIPTKPIITNWVPTPCQALTAKTDSDAYMDKFNAINKDANFNLPYETGFIEKKVGVTTEYVDGVASGSAALTIPPETVAFTHVHNNKKKINADGDEFDASVKMLSPADLGILLVECKNNAGINPQDAYGIMIANDAIYSLTLLDATIDMSFVSSKWAKFKEDYLKKAEELLPDTSMSVSERNEELQIMMLKGLKNLGLENKVGLFQGNVETTATGTKKINWIRKTISPTNTLIEKPC